MTTNPTSEDNSKKGNALFFQARDMRLILPKQVEDITDIELAIAYAHLALWRMQKSLHAYALLRGHSYDLEDSLYTQCEKYGIAGSLSEVQSRFLKEAENTAEKIISTDTSDEWEVNFHKEQCLDLCGISEGLWGIISLNITMFRYTDNH